MIGHAPDSSAELKGSCISGMLPVRPPVVAPELGYADQVAKLLEPLVRQEIFSEKEVQLLIKLGPDSHTFSELVEMSPKATAITPAQARHCEFLGEIVAHGLNQVLNVTELKAAILTPIAAQAETLKTIDNLLAMKQVLAQVANQSSDGKSTWEPLTTGEGLMADCDRLMSKCPGMRQTMERYFARLDLK